MLLHKFVQEHFFFLIPTAKAIMAFLYYWRKYEKEEL